jgi:hypothetical protein
VEVLGGIIYEGSHCALVRVDGSFRDISEFEGN